MLDNAKVLRSNQTDAERRLWYHLRAHRFMGFKFKRQKPMGRYIVDFVCLEHRLIIELDGGQHTEQAVYDQHRDAWLRSQGYSVLRFWNNDVMQQLESVLEQIHCALSHAWARGATMAVRGGSGRKQKTPLSRRRERGRGRGWRQKELSRVLCWIAAE